MDSELCDNLLLEQNAFDFIWSPNEYSLPLEQQPADNLGNITGNIPSRDDFPGNFNFKFSLDQVASGQNWVYSVPLKQLFIGMNKVLVIQFEMSPVLWTLNCKFYIRALPVYSSDDHINLPVNRCTFHSCEDDPQRKAHTSMMPGQCFCVENNLVGHVVRAECRDAEYHYDSKSERHSVRVFISTPQAGSDTISIPFSFACKTSCPKGMQRRPIHVIFTLEDELTRVYGRQKLGVKICSCPKRDKKRQEDDYKTEKGVENKKKRPITKEDLSVALSSTKQIKLEEPLSNGDMRQQMKDDIQKLKRLHAEFTSIIKRLEENVEKFTCDQE